MLGCLLRRFIVEDLEVGTFFDPPFGHLAAEDEQDVEQDDKEPVSTRLLNMQCATNNDIEMTQPCRSCSLERAAESVDLTWDREMGAGTYGRVSFVFHQQSVFAVKELTEAAGKSERFAAESEMEAIVRFLRGAAKGLAHVRSCGKMHGDIKPSNIILVPDKNNATTIAFIAKIADFCFTEDVGTIARMGTRGYGAPELVEQEAQTNIDAFSFGVVIMQTLGHPEVAEHNMFTHSLILTDAEKIALDDIFEAHPDDPNAGQILEDLVMKRTLADGSFGATILTPDNIRPDVPQQDMVCDLLKRCLSPQPANRPNMQQVVQDLAFLCRASV